MRNKLCRGGYAQRSPDSSAFDSPTRPGWHRHHLVPRHVERYADLDRFIAGLRAYHFRLGDFATNGMFLPATETIAAFERLPLHRGPHWRYNDMVLAALDRIYQLSRVTSPPTSTVAGAVRLLQLTIRKVLQRSALETDVVLGSRDPFGTTTALVALDAETDLLFANALARP